MTQNKKLNRVLCFCVYALPFVVAFVFAIVNKGVGGFTMEAVLTAINSLIGENVFSQMFEKFVLLFNQTDNLTPIATFVCDIFGYWLLIGVCRVVYSFFAWILGICTIDSDWRVK